VAAGNVAVDPAGTAGPPAGAGIPAGYQRVGGSAQGISLAAPKAWIPINLAKESIDSAAAKMQMPGADATTVEQDMQALKKDHAIFVFDVKSAATDPNHYTRNLNAYCLPSGVNDPGKAGTEFVKQAVQSDMSTIASDVTQQEVTIGGIPGLKTSYRLNSGSGMDVRG